MKVKETILKASSLLILTGCVSKEFIAYEPTCPSRPVLPLVMETELHSLDQDTYQRLVERELRLKEHIDLLRSFCKPL